MSKAIEKQIRKILDEAIQDNEKKRRPRLWSPATIVMSVVAICATVLLVSSVVENNQLRTELHDTVNHRVKHTPHIVIEPGKCDGLIMQAGADLYCGIIS